MNLVHRTGEAVRTDTLSRSATDPSLGSAQSPQVRPSERATDRMEKNPHFVSSRPTTRRTASSIAASLWSPAIKAVATAALGVGLLGVPLVTHAQGATAPLDLRLSPYRPRSVFDRLASERPPPSHPVARALEAGVTTVMHTTVGVAMVDALYPGQSDKKLHAIAGGLVAGLTSSYVTERTGRPWLGAAAGCGAALAVGLAKEAYDSTGRGHVDRHDVVATAVGGAPVCLRLNISF